MLFACIFTLMLFLINLFYFVCTFILNYFRVYYDMLSIFNNIVFWDCMRKISSKHIEVRSYFDVFIEANSMVQSDFNFDD